MMINKCFLIFILVMFSTNVYCQDIDPVVVELAAQLEGIKQEIDQNSRRITENFVNLEKRISVYSSELASLGKTRKDIETKYEKILSVGAEIKMLNDLISEQIKKQAVLEEKINQFRVDLTSTKNEISTSQTIVTWVTLIVSVLVVLIGLFFSKLFLDLYSNYKVVCSHLPSEKRSQIGIKEDA